MKASSACRQAESISLGSEPEVRAQALNVLGAALYTAGISVFTPAIAREQQCKDAQTALEEATALAPGFSSALFNLARIQVQYRLH